MARSEEALTGKPQKQFGTLYSCRLKVYAVFSGLNRKDLAGILLFRQKINFFFFFNFCRDTVGGECLEATQLDKTDGN